MQLVHIWEIKSTLESTRTDSTYKITQNVITKEKSFSEAEKVGMEFMYKIQKENYNHCLFEGLDEITYKYDVGTLLLSTEEN
ncbi:hypothetical protein [Bacillus wiedmannii]|uniref:Uncharacterized protein n=1 Tax=Bacillus wiedmannii TaxID=1890302 RepID=A0ABX5DK72_9BACI|nr:hypothetical protein [Bacillus wiedmannii]PRT35313.1 hypothetical protein C6357_29395 [Bacillus wiedmannii]